MKTSSQKIDFLFFCFSLSRTRSRHVEIRASELSARARRVTEKPGGAKKHFSLGEILSKVDIQHSESFANPTGCMAEHTTQERVTSTGKQKKTESPARPIRGDKGRKESGRKEKVRRASQSSLSRALERNKSFISLYSLPLCTRHQRGWWGGTSGGRERWDRHGFLIALVLVNFLLLLFQSDFLYRLVLVRILFFALSLLSLILAAPVIPVFPLLGVDVCRSWKRACCCRLEGQEHEAATTAKAFARPLLAFVFFRSPPPPPPPPPVPRAAAVASSCCCCW